MKYKKFRIRNYKAINDLTIELDNQNLVPIIGLNETGKSSILQAIFAFDCFNDKQYNGEFINYDYIKNKFENKQNPIIEAEIENIDKNGIILKSHTELPILGDYKKINEKEFLKECLENSIKLYSLEEYYLEKIYNETSYFLLGYANLTNEEIEGGILLLLKILKEYYI